MRVAGALFYRHLVALARDRQTLFWNTGFFVLLLAIFLGPLSGGDAAVRVTLAAGLVTTQIMANALFGVSVGLASARDRGVFRRYAVTPAPAGLAVGGAIAARLVIVVAAAALMVVVAAAGFDVPWTGGVVSWLAVVLAGTAAFAAVGFAIAAHARAPHVANTMANVVFIPMLALGGAALPTSMMPAAWQPMHGLLPTAAIFDGLLGAFIRAESTSENLPRIGYLLLWAAVAGGWAARQWRRRGV